jgi:hypothetical protein
MKDPIDIICTQEGQINWLLKEIAMVGESLGLDEDDCQIHSKIIAIKELKREIVIMSAIAHRLSIELECLVMDTKDLSIQSKHWDSAMAVLSDWHEMWDKEQPHVSAFGKD